MIGLGFGGPSKALFFDSARVLAMMDKETIGYLSRFGAYCRQVMKNSIKRKPYGETSAPGTPPYDHSGGQFKGGKGYQGIQFAADLETQSVVIGPVLYRPKGYIVPQTLEEGGTVMGVVLGPRVRGQARLKGLIEMHFRPRPFKQAAFDKTLERQEKFWK